MATDEPSTQPTSSPAPNEDLNRNWRQPEFPARPWRRRFWERTAVAVLGLMALYIPADVVHNYHEQAERARIEERQTRIENDQKQRRAEACCALQKPEEPHRGPVGPCIGIRRNDPQRTAIRCSLAAECTRDALEACKTAFPAFEFFALIE